MPRSNSFCAAGLHDVSKCTLPSCFSLAAACAGWAAQINVSAAKAFRVYFLIMISSQCRVSLVLGAKFSSLLLREKVLLCPCINAAPALAASQHQVFAVLDGSCGRLE